MDYTVLVDEYIGGLIESVKKMSAQGWELCGGVACAPHRLSKVGTTDELITSYRYAQAMFKRDLGYAEMLTLSVADYAMLVDAEVNINHKTLDEALKKIPEDSRVEVRELLENVWWKKP